MIRPISDWRWVLARAWSIRLTVLAALLSGLEVAFAVFTDNPPIDRGIFAGLSGLTTIAAFGARLIAQRDGS